MAKLQNYGAVLVELTGDGSEEPLQIEVRGSAKALFIQLITAAVIGMFALFINDMLPTDQFGGFQALVERVLPLAMGAVACLLALRAVLARFARTSVRIANGSVAVQRRSLFGTREWNEPLRAYEGVRWTRFAIHERRGQGHATRTRYRHVLELAHGDREKCLPLVVYETGRANVAATLALAKKAFAAKNEDEAELRAEAEQLGKQAGAEHLREKWEALAATLEVSAIDARDGVETRRDAEDLDKSVRQLADEGKIDINWDSAPPPPSLETEATPSSSDPDRPGVRIVIRVAHAPVLIYIFGGVGGLMAVIGLVTLQFGLMLGGLVFGALAVFLFWQGRNNPRTLTVANGEIRYEDPNVQSRSFTLPLAGIESIELRDRDSESANERTLKLQGKELLISSDQGEYPAGAGLSEDALNWLRGYLLDAAAKS